MAILYSFSSFLLIFYYYFIHLKKINKFDKLRNKVSIGEICYSCHSDIEFFFPKFDFEMCKSCERHEKILRIEGKKFNKIKIRSILLKNIKKILLYSLIVNLLFIIVVLFTNFYFLYLANCFIWIIFIYRDYSLIRRII
jgi:type II secretory pathway component PulF